MAIRIDHPPKISRLRFPDCDYETQNLSNPILGDMVVLVFQPFKRN